MSDRSTNHATFVIERTYDARPSAGVARVGGPRGEAPLVRPAGPAKTEHELEFRVGGLERMTVQTPDGALYTFAARYQDIVEGERFIHTYEMYRGRRAHLGVGGDRRARGRRATGRS